MNYLRILIIMLLSGVIMSCADISEKQNPSTTPIIEFYKKEGLGKFDCMIPMTAGTHSFQSNSCSNDDDYYFIIRNPREGVLFGIYDNPNCDYTKAGWAVYRIFNPDYGVPTELLSVDAGYAFHDGGVGTEIVRGIYSYSHDAEHRQLAGKVSCLRVFSDLPAANTNKDSHQAP